MRYGRRRLFDGLSVTVEPGAPLAVVGATGSGESTLLLLLHPRSPLKVTPDAGPAGDAAAPQPPQP